MAFKLSPYQFFGTDASGDPLNGYKLFTYSAGSATKKTTSKDSAGGSSHANPIVLDTLGFPSSPIWLTEGQTYKFVVASPTDSDPPTGTVRTFDNISGVNDTAVTIDQWVSSGLTPTYVSATSFTFAGDQTSTFHIGRRLKTTNSGGTVYSTISNSVYGSLTTITVVNDSGTLDSGLSAVSYGLVSVTNTSAPIASQTVRGVIELATNGEVQTLTDAVRAVTPAGLAACTATEARTGILELATDAEALAGTDTSRAVTSAGLASSKSLSAGGYQKFPGGLILQWGIAGSNASGNATITWPVAFASAVYHVSVTDNAGASIGRIWDTSGTHTTTTGYANVVGIDGLPVDTTGFYFAIGV